MNKKNIIVRFVNMNTKTQIDIDTPLEITANEFVIALNQAYNLGLDTRDTKNCYFVVENPIAFLKGTKSLEEFGLHNGSIIYYKG